MSPQSKAAEAGGERFYAYVVLDEAVEPFQPVVVELSRAAARDYIRTFGHDGHQLRIVRAQVKLYT